MPLIFRCAIKPTPSIAKMQSTVDFVKKECIDYPGRGRHDPCIVHRASVVVNSVCALVLADMLAQRYGTDFLASDAESAT
jgi:chorismate synthase